MDSFEILVYFGISLSVLSLLSTIFVISLHFLFESLRTFHFRLIVYLQTADLMISLSQFLNIFKENASLDDQSADNSFVCLFQAFLTQYGSLSTIIWAMMIISLMVISLSESPNQMQKHEKTLIFLGFYLPGLFSVIPFFFGFYGNSGAFCWISTQLEPFLTKLLMIFFYYLWLWVGMAYNVGLMVYIGRSLRQMRRKKLVENIDFYNKIKYFPMILIAWWSFPSIHRLYQIISGKDSLVLGVFHIFFESSYGFVNMIVYALNPKVRGILREKFAGKSKENRGNFSDLILNNLNNSHSP